MVVPESAQGSTERDSRLMATNMRLRTELAEARAEIARLQPALEEAQEALRSKSDALAHMSHELRMPMNGIIGMTQLALETELDDRQRGYLQVVKSSADALLTLINDVLDFAKLEAGRLEIEAIPFDLLDTINHSVRSMEVLADQKGLSLETEYGSGVPAALQGDPGRLRQVLVNLIGNAIKFTDEGSVRVSVAVEGSCSTGDVCLQFSVIDTGVGIPPEAASAIFEPFDQAGRRQAARRGGTGLGLSISADLVRLMGGRIWVESTPGIGSAFHFTVRLGLQTARTKPAAAPGPHGTGGRPVLVLASGEAGTALASKLAAVGIDAVPIGSEEEARPLVATLGPVAALVDLDGIGFEGAARLRSELDGTPVVVLTSSGQRGDAGRCREHGIGGYLTRPAEARDLRDAVLSVAGGTEGALVTRHWLREHRRPLRVLVADDHATNRELLEIMLGQHDHTVLSVEDGIAAVEAFQTGGYDLVLMDVDMPLLGGLDATRRIRGIEAGASRIPILALTGHSAPEDVARCLEAGMDAHVIKPFEIEELMLAIDRLLPPLAAA